MNSRERVIAAMRRREPDRVPFDFAHGFTPQQIDNLERRTGTRDPNAYFETDTRTVGIGPTRHKADFSRYHPNLPERAYLDEWGIGHLPTESGAAEHRHLTGFLYSMQCLETVRDAEEYPLPDIDAEYRYEHLPEQIECLHAQGLAVTASVECTVFEMAWYLRSMERLFVDFVENPAFAETLLDRITEKRETQARRLAELGVDIIRFGDDIASQRGMLMSVPTWRRWLKPRLARAIAAAKQGNSDVLIFYHSDGNPSAVIPDVIEIGVDILNPVQPECMDPALLKAQHGDRLSFWGAIGTQSTFPFGTPDDVRREVRHRIETVGRGGGLLLGPTHMVEPEVPWENIVAFVETVKEFGRYAG
jgi:uroporphyrinogen decarboxylase